jgi:shikimate kinase
MQPDKTPHIFLVGFMGSGKSTVGPRLAARLGRSFHDLDRLIEQEEGMPVSEIFRQKGELHFRSIESEVLRRLVSQPPAVIALGGGAFTSPDNRQLIRRNGTSIWLKIPLSVARERCLSDPSRPLARSESEFTRLYHSRQPLYQSANLLIKVGGKPVDMICDEILVRIAGKMPSTE